MAVNATVIVRYCDSCGINCVYDAIFNKQIIIGPGEFSSSGDSGSLIVDLSAPPHPVGLLFAGSDTITIANPIDRVLSSLNISIVGEGETSEGDSEPGVQLPLSPKSQKAIEAAGKVKDRNEKAIFNFQGVVAVGVGLADHTSDQAVINVFTTRPFTEMKRVIPKKLEGIPIQIIETGDIIAY